MKILITVSFDGTNYNGYQLQGEKPTVALMLNKSAEKTFGFPCNVTGCSRTDSGVHALGFAATLEPRSKKDAITVPVDKIALAMNANLPDDISVLSACPVDDTFHPRYGVVKKEYVYKIHDSEIRNPFYKNKVLEYGKRISDDELQRMNVAASQFIGTHHFDSFMSSGSKITDTERTVFGSCIKRDGDIIEFTVCADGFLYNMVRIMVGTLLSVASGKIKETDITSIIDGRDRRLAGPTAKACGLYLKKVIYNY